GALPRARAPRGRVSRHRARREPQGSAGEEGPSLILVDSSGWIEYLADRPKARRFSPYIEGREPLLVSAIEIHEVYKVIRRDLSEERAMEAVSALRRATIAPVDEPLALEAADLSLAHGLAMADSLVYATARRFQATLVTGDADFQGLPGTVVVR
ncbi:MAG: type II toxin-antitoxin system VapC family toxin, partial [Candidatus Rokuibacteriota bacterium]